MAVDHTSGSEHETTRNVLKESARITRGDIRPLHELVQQVDRFDCVIFPGGFGAAKNLSTWATGGFHWGSSILPSPSHQPTLRFPILEGTACSVDEDVAAVIKTFHAAGKPMGA